MYQPPKAVFDALLNLTDLGNNNNKYYIIQMLETDGNANKNYYCWNRWGRVGEERSYQNALRGPMSLAEARADFEKKFWDKTKNEWDERGDFQTVRGKYTLIQRDYGPEAPPPAAPSNPDAPPAQCTLDPAVAGLVELVCDVSMMERSMREIGFDAERLPLGKLTKGTLAQAMRV